MLAQFSIVPVGAGSSLSGQLASVLKLVDGSGLPYKLNPMGTVVEGDWDEIMGLIKSCRNEIMKEQERVLISISIDDRKGMPNRIEAKISSLEEKVGRTLKK
ncbi:MAG: MTH1187 family thiamine-binding protein [Thermodesulfovibrionales bacterium]|jgi:uncharacterized protein (TIGR00106 family)